MQTLPLQPRHASRVASHVAGPRRSGQRPVVYRDLGSNAPAGRAHPTSRSDGSKAVERDGRANRGGAARSGRTLNLAELAFERVEDAVIERTLADHPRRDAALDRLLDDMDRLGPALSDAAGASMCHPMPLEPSLGRSSAPAFPEQKLRRIEQMLVAAVVLEGHPARERALDRLLHDISPNAARTADEVEAERARYDMSCDNDFDGLS